MSYAVVHMEKMKAYDLKGMQFHHQRERESRTNPDIDKERSYQNYDLVNEDPIDFNKRVKEIIESQKTGTRKTRKDAVLVNELLITSDREFFDRLDPDETRKFFEDSLTFFQERYGKQNIAYAVVHMDEKTPHMHMGVVPMRDGRLQSKNVFNRQELLWLQDKFPEHMQKMGFELERGEKGFDREHLSVQDFKRKTAKEQLEKEIASLEKKLSGKKNELLTLNEEISDEVRISAKREMKKVEVKTEERNLFGIPKKEIKKKPTGNILVPEKEFKQLVAAARDNKQLKSRMEKILRMDLAKENQKLASQLNGTLKGLKEKERENQRLNEENYSLRSQNHELRQEIHFLYQSTKEFLKERTESVRAFKNVFKDFVGKVKEKVIGSEFERLYKREKARERNTELER
ncbi:MobV family relaxase [Bacillus badius]|uniref:Plasmid recombination enzyme n=2 Tax=Bacillus badius TaxID=1455 RepID=A0ABR5AQE0_BACBA|nr:MobV family relaxase [Bacillus badius]KIL72120.1 Plasmid recombination enzyme [Bacillus badius]OVE45998.1 plasmid recombination enzyme [Bacillus badius]